MTDTRVVVVLLSGKGDEVCNGSYSRLARTIRPRSELQCSFLNRPVDDEVHVVDQTQTSISHDVPASYPRVHRPRSCAMSFWGWRGLSERLDERREAIEELRRTENLRDSEKRKFLVACRPAGAPATSETPEELSSIGAFALVVWERGFVKDSWCRSSRSSSGLPGTVANKPML